MLPQTQTQTQGKKTHVQLDWQHIETGLKWLSCQQWRTVMAKKHARFPRWFVRLYLIAHCPFEISPTSVDKPLKSTETSLKLPNLSIPHVNVTKSNASKIITHVRIWEAMLDMFLREILNTQTVSDFLHAIFAHVHGTHEKESIWLKIKQHTYKSAINPASLLAL